MQNPALNIAIKAARRAGNLLTRMYARHNEISYSAKLQHDFVSEADHAAEAEIIDEIHKAHPDHAILSEEQGNVTPLQAGSSDCRWIIDPLDGTQNLSLIHI